jgi:cytochrome b6-f complex iron-sulfur subunit
VSASTVALIATIFIVALAALFVFTASARRDRAAALGGRDRAATDEAPAEPAVTGREVERAAVLERRGVALMEPADVPPPVRAPMDPETLEVTRRQFLTRGTTGFFVLGLTGFGAASIGFLWPSLSGGFGSKINAGKLDDIVDEIQEKREPMYVPQARSWLSVFPKESVAKAKDVYTGAVLAGMEQGIVALYQKCVHLGCRVPWCQASQWFECPCHGSQYNRVGEKKGGPAPRGLDRFGVEVQGGSVTIDTTTVVQGPPIGTDTTGQEAEGPHCA